MSSYYGYLFPEYFTGNTGREIARRGGAHAQLLGAYLTANRSATMLGLYAAPLAVIVSDIHSLSTDQVAKAFGVLQETGFARYDSVTEVVWVVEMARIRLQLMPKQALKEDDKRVLAMQKLYDRCVPNPFLSPFHTKYRNVLRLAKKRRFEAPWKPLLESLDLHREAPPPAPPSQVQVQVQVQKQVQGSGIRDQKELQEDQDPAPRVVDIVPHLLKAGHDYIEAHPDCAEHDLSKELQTVAGRCGVPQREYTTSALQPTLDQLLATRTRRGQAVPA